MDQQLVLEGLYSSSSARLFISSGEIAEEAKLESVGIGSKSAGGVEEPGVPQEAVRLREDKSSTASIASTCLCKSSAKRLNKNSPTAQYQLSVMYWNLARRWRFWSALMAGQKSLLPSTATSEAAICAQA